jgi:hypothetical protein
MIFWKKVFKIQNNLKSEFEFEIQNEILKKF